MISVQLDDIRPPVPSISPRFSGAVNMTLTITPDIANGEIGFISNRTVVLLEPEDTNSSLVKTFYSLCCIYSTPYQCKYKAEKLSPNLCAQMCDVASVF